MTPLDIWKRHAFPAGLVNDRQVAELAPIMGATLHKVVGPHMARIFRAKPDARPVVEPLSAVRAYETEKGF